MATAVGEDDTAAGSDVGDEGTGVVVAVDVGEGTIVGDVVAVFAAKLVGVTVGCGSTGGSPSGGSPPSSAWIR